MSPMLKYIFTGVKLTLNVLQRKGWKMRKREKVLALRESNNDRCEF